MIDGANKDDAGTYTFVASNDYGTSTAAVKLEVEGNYNFFAILSS